jgi:hypothetical protein
MMFKSGNVGDFLKSVMETAANFTEVVLDNQEQTEWESDYDQGEKRDVRRGMVHKWSGEIQILSIGFLCILYSPP